MSDVQRASSDEGAQYITVGVGAQLFGIPVERVQDVFTPQSITRVPLAPVEIAGVLNLRGKIVTALDIRARLGLAKRPEAGPVMAIGIESGGESYGLVVDEVGEVLTLDASKFEPLPDTLDTHWRAVSKSVYHL
ncbi:MAG TPA: chemotaxis protein CheW, partial [Alphaproteobacteria bacterium]|nr:chemotaxis protein CheW [Alphaproteobacteria bacterium]